MSFVIFTIAFSCTSICSPNDDRSRNWNTGCPSMDRRGVPSKRRATRPLAAQVRAPAQAVVAVAAEHREARDDVVARLHVGDVLADGLDDAGRLMARHRRVMVRVLALHEVEVAVAQPGGRPCGSSTSPRCGLSIATSSITSSPGMTAGRLPSWKFPLDHRLVVRILVDSKDEEANGRRGRSPQGIPQTTNSGSSELGRRSSRTSAKPACSR